MNASTYRDLFKCTQTKVIVCIVVSSLILTLVTYQKLYNVNETRPSRKKGNIPQHHGDALHLYRHLDQKIKEKEQKLKDLGIDPGIGHVNDDTSSISDANTKQKQALTTSTTTTTTTTTKKPTPKPTQKKEPQFPKYFDIDLDDSVLHDLQWIRDRMYYWKKGIAKHKEPKPTSGQYLTFWTDCGGFNNIRMG
eukprot:36223_1